MDNPLWVCWSVPPELPDKVKMLSFLSPSGEEECIQKYGTDRVISGRKIAQDVKDDALKIYIRVVARIGAEKVCKGKSLRESLKHKNGLSQWWYHPDSFKDCEADPTFNRLIKILSIEKIASETRISKVILWNAESMIVDVIRSKYPTEDHHTVRLSFFYALLRAVLSRARTFVIQLYYWHLVKSLVADKECQADLALEGFWDWSIRDGNGTLDDRYFKSLPRILEKRGLAVIWFLWFSPDYEPGMNNRRAKDVVLKARSHNGLFFLQKYLTIRDFCAFWDFHPAVTYLTFCGKSEFRKVFHENCFDLFPLFKRNLVCNFLNSSLPFYGLVDTACGRAFARHQPKMALTFLELFPYSRAFYSGARRGSPNTVLASMQHASYSREKTYLRLDPELEFLGHPDDCPVPQPNYIFAMGELGKTIFKECGYAADKIFLTGSSRYEHLTNERSHAEKAGSGKIKLLMVTTTDRDMEMDMVEAVFLAAQETPDVELHLRSHPFAKMEEHPDFHKFGERIHTTTGTLEEDLEDADVILFSYSTAAEEAFIKGIPVWQWRSATFNGSSFRDIDTAIPSFTCAKDLSISLKNFIRNPQIFSPGAEAKNLVERMCFYRADGNSSKRIAAEIENLITPRR